MCEKSKIHKLNISAITVILFSLLLSTAVFGATKGYSNGSGVNVRAGASTETESLGKLEMKQPVEIIGKEAGFVKISFDGMEGFVREDFITIDVIEAFVNDDNVNVRGNGGNEIIGQLNAGEVINLTGRYNDMLAFDYQGKIGLVSKNNVYCEYKDILPEITVEQLPITYAEVISDSSLNLREAPSSEAGIIGSLPSGDILDVVEKGGEWTKVRTYDDKTGYVSSEFVDVKVGVKPERPAASKGNEIIAYAKQFIGTPYRYGGTSLTSGVDCSGFVYSVYRNFGITLNRSSSSMPANGYSISKGELVAGDLVFFSNGGAKNIQHVGIYCGDGTFIHSASGGNMRVMISGMGEDYYVNNYITAARVL